MKKSTKVLVKKVEAATRADIAAIGIDLSDRSGKYYAIDDQGERVESGKVKLTKTAVAEWGKQFPPTLIAIEAGTHSPWISRVLAACGHEVIVANPVKVALITKNTRKTDRIDAEYLARLARFERKLLHEITHRGEEAQNDLQLVRTREIAVGARTKLIGHVRGSVKALGERLPVCSTEAFTKKTRETLPRGIAQTLEPIFVLIDNLSATISDYDRRVRALVETKYSEAKQLMQVRGVGPLTALTFVLVLEDARRFSPSRSVGAYLGFTPKSDQSGDSDPQLGTTKSGDRLLRRLLIQSAHYILGPFGVDCDLRRHGEKIASRGGKNAKKRAAVAVARKLAVLLHRLWLTGEIYEQLYNANKQALAAAGVLPLVKLPATSVVSSSASLQP